MSEIINQIKSDLYDMYLSTSFELRKHYRRNRIQLAVLLAVVLAAIFYVIPTIWDIGLADTAKGFASINLSFVNILIIISGALFAGDIISSEFENRTGLILFPTPQNQSSIFIGKYAASMISTFSVLSLYYVVTALEIQYVYGLSGIMTEFMKSYLFSILYMFAAVSLIFFFTSILKRAITSTLLGFFSLLMIFPIVEQVLKIVEIEPWFLISYYQGFITDVFGLVQSVPSGPPDSVFGITFTPDFYVGILVLIGYTVVLFIMSLFAACRRRME